MAKPGLTRSRGSDKQRGRKPEPGLAHAAAEAEIGHHVVDEVLEPRKLAQKCVAECIEIGLTAGKLHGLSEGGVLLERFSMIPIARLNLKARKHHQARPFRLNHSLSVRGLIKPGVRSGRREGSGELLMSLPRRGPCFQRGGGNALATLDHERATHTHRIRVVVLSGRIGSVDREG